MAVISSTQPVLAGAASASVSGSGNRDMRGPIAGRGFATVISRMGGVVAFLEADHSAQRISDAEHVRASARTDRR
jgi:hypothetical protein